MLTTRRANFELISSLWLWAAARIVTLEPDEKSDLLQGFGNSSALEITARNAKVNKNQEALIPKSFGEKG